jgi:RNA-splicing ligase RtcB
MFDVEVECRNSGSTTFVMAPSSNQLRPIPIIAREARRFERQHGPGRRIGRTKAKELFTAWKAAQQFLRQRGVTLLSAGLDEVPMAYKDIDDVMAGVGDLVEPLARFDPRLVKMAPAGEPAED